MERKGKIIAGGTLAAAVILGAAGVSLASANDGDSDTPLQGSSLDRATAAALDETGGGTVVDSEVGDDGAAYSVEVKLDDGTVVEVNLDDNYKVIGQSADDDGPGDSDGNGTDD